MIPQKGCERALLYLRRPRLARQPNRTLVQNQVGLLLRDRPTVAFGVMPRRWQIFQRTVGRESRPVLQVLTLTEIQNLGLKTKGPEAVTPAWTNATWLFRLSRPFFGWYGCCRRARPIDVTAITLPKGYCQLPRLLLLLVNQLVDLIYHRAGF